MIKKLISAACLLALIVSTTAAYAFVGGDEPKYTEITLDKVSAVSDDKINVLTLSSEEVGKIEDPVTKTQLIDFLNSYGLIVCRDDEGLNASVLDSYFDLRVQGLNRDNIDAKSASTVDPGKDIAIIYYLDKNDMISTHTINVSSVGATDTEHNNTLIEETVERIVQKRNQPVEIADAQADELVGQAIGERGYTYTRPPKGKLEAEYEFYTVQNENNKDYYLVFCTINGIPGAALYEDYPSYQEKYEGENMEVKIVPVTTSVELDDYGPDRTITSSSVTYGVDIGVGGQDVVISRSISYSRNISDTEIATRCNTTDAIWELTIYDPAQVQNCRFEPAATFECSSVKTSVDFNLFASYTLDSTFTAAEDISFEIPVTCTETSVVWGE